MISRLGKAIAIVMFLIFLFGVIVQYNDPDPVKWMAIYAGAAAASLLAVLGRMPRWLPIIVALAAILWGVSMAPGLIGRVPILEMFEEFEMKSEVIEESREMYGLFLIAAGMILLLILQRRRSRG